MVRSAVRNRLGTRSMPITWNGGAALRTAVRSSAVHLERRSPGIGIHGEDAAGTNGYGCCQVGGRGSSSCSRAHECSASSQCSTRFGGCPFSKKDAGTISGGYVRRFPFPFSRLTSEDFVIRGERCGVPPCNILLASHPFWNDTRERASCETPLISLRRVLVGRSDNDRWFCWLLSL